MHLIDFVNNLGASIEAIRGIKDDLDTQREIIKSVYVNDASSEKDDVEDIDEIVGNNANFDSIINDLKEEKQKLENSKLFEKEKDDHYF